MEPIADDDLGRALSTAVVMFHEAVGRRLGLSAVDQRALALVHRTGPVTAGRLAQETGLTPGAVTGLLDRLESRGLVHRAVDPDDRRRVLVSPAASPDGADDAFEGLRREMAEVMAGFRPEEAQVIGEYVRRTVEVLRRQTRLLSEGP
ncbi:MarR family transcriptional regulator [Phycicoccus sp. CSK15P-2]|uniref:MarR family winged helix-turn-helix transcriptional regulator n=1 Tax=Phycicoccus sp. CSK15P-2 TaxID=2807627 RepID=UPI00194E8CE8|nr:MarR family transcriptional regulator [Phycicoccus sp. CSK15P-2]MBM6403563.1 MarR family transcriptional regulator [Phycicoccus sp. CSK15P-2]